MVDIKHDKCMLSHRVFAGSICNCRRADDQIVRLLDVLHWYVSIRCIWGRGGGESCRASPARGLGCIGCTAYSVGIAARLAAGRQAGYSAAGDSRRRGGFKRDSERAERVIRLEGSETLSAVAMND